MGDTIEFDFSSIEQKWIGETPSTKVLVNENSQDLNQCITSVDIYNSTNLILWWCWI